MLYKNILLIDDDPEDAELFIGAVDSINKGIRMQWSSNPQRALEDLSSSENPPDLIFLDYNMPKINGFEVIEQLKSDRKLAEIPVILISTPSAEFAKELVQNKKILRYISKPTNYVEFIALLNSIL